MRKVLFTSVLYCLTLFFMTLLLSVTAVAEKTDTNRVIKWHDWSNDAFALANQEKKLVLLDISAPWCQFCKKMKAVTYKDPGVINIINENYIAIHADIELSTDVRMLYGDFGVPGTVIFSADREELNKRLGYIPPREMQWHLLGSLQDAPDVVSHIPPAPK